MGNNKVALIYGVTGQTGSYLAEILLRKGYLVVGVKRRTSIINTSRVDHLYNDPNFKLEYGDTSDVGSIYGVLNKYKPDQVYFLSAQSHVAVSFQIPEFTVDSIAMGITRLLTAIREVVPNAKFYNAGSSEQFGVSSVPVDGYDEESKFEPASPYACAKTFAYHYTNNMKNSYDMFATSGILFNHSSPRRGETFVSRKLSLAAARIKCGIQDKLFLGNLDSKRDIGYAKEYAEAINLIVEQEEPDNFVIATGKTYSIREIAECVFDYAGLGDAQKYIEIDQRLFRPQEVPYLLGNASKAKKVLGWEPKIDMVSLIKIMYDNDLRMVKGEIAAAKEKYRR